MEKEREIEIIEHEISQLDKKILMFVKNDISAGKRKKLESKKFKFLNKLHLLKKEL